MLLVKGRRRAAARVVAGPPTVAGVMAVVPAGRGVVAPLPVAAAGLVGG